MDICLRTEEWNRGGGATQNTACCMWPIKAEEEDKQELMHGYMSRE